MCHDRTCDECRRSREAAIADALRRREIGIASLDPMRPRLLELKRSLKLVLLGMEFSDRITALKARESDGR